MSDNQRPDRRRTARMLALQALYQLYMNEGTASAVEAQFLADQNFKHADKRLFRSILAGVASHQEQLDIQISALLDRAITELDPIEHCILRIGAFELTNSVAVPYKVVINEGVELGKIFGATDGHKYINGILDKLAIKHRPIEMAAKKS